VTQEYYLWVAGQKVTRPAKGEINLSVYDAKSVNNQESKAGYRHSPV
jgi:hypothetical protein